MNEVSVTFDTSELDNLNGLLGEAITRVDKERASALSHHAELVASTARATVRGYTKGTGVLAEDISVTGTPLTRVVGSPLREAFFLEFGSPNTGAPRPWLTGPARVEMTELLKELGHAAEPW